MIPNRIPIGPRLRSATGVTLSKEPASTALGHHLRACRAKPRQLSHAKIPVPEHSRGQVPEHSRGQVPEHSRGQRCRGLVPERSRGHQTKRSRKFESVLKPGLDCARPPAPLHRENRPRLRSAITFAHTERSRGISRTRKYRCPCIVEGSAVEGRCPCIVEGSTVEGRCPSVVEGKPKTD
jgi:hypothetical protein